MKLRTIVTVIAILFIAAVFANASCVSPRCPLDGATLLLEKTYYNGLQKSEQWGHTDYVSKEHHSFIFQCN